MNRARIYCFTAAALLSTAVYGQTCSGGAGGGTDATGNECGIAVEAPTTPIVSARSTGVQIPPDVAVVPVASGKMSRRELRLIRYRSAHPHAAPAEPIKASTMATHDDTAGCSTGVSGGMDATGNECKVEDDR
jgi:hypothetical protein